eukprot:TRINITY_DN11883_c0_g1_i1.p3 TRINITY_DN11883_c0_g1~~TRINITY_DN11883_c0_g1_i1.p3  ORF type:complete len:107 (-),score=30.32 TRINITY_DN11883_c0_g1_i1:270-590(-)
MAMKARSALLPCLLIAAAVFAFMSSTTFVSQPAPRAMTADLKFTSAQTLPLGVAGAVAIATAPAEPAHALLLQDEILPISFAVIGATLWGIVLGFVLLRLQEAFPE